MADDSNSISAGGKGEKARALSVSWLTKLCRLVSRAAGNAPVEISPSGWGTWIPSDKKHILDLNRIVQAAKNSGSLPTPSDTTRYWMMIYVPGTGWIAGGEVPNEPNQEGSIYVFTCVVNAEMIPTFSWVPTVNC